MEIMWTLIVTKFFDYFFRVNFRDSFLNLDNLRLEKMSDSGYMALRQLKEKRIRDMSKNFCHRFVQDVMKKYDT